MLQKQHKLILAFWAQTPKLITLRRSSLPSSGAPEPPTRRFPEESNDWSDRCLPMRHTAPEQPRLRQRHHHQSQHGESVEELHGMDRPPKRINILHEPGRSRAGCIRSFTGCDPDPADSPRTWSAGLGLAVERVDLMSTSSPAFTGSGGSAMPIPSNSWCSSVEPCPLIASAGLFSCTFPNRWYRHRTGPWFWTLATGKPAHRIWIDPKPRFAGPKPVQQFFAAPHPGGAGGSIS